MGNRLPILRLSKDGALASLNPRASESEDYMRARVSKHPEFVADDDGTLLLIKRQQPIRDGDVAGRWSVDQLFVSRCAMPVLLELKRTVQEAAK